MSNVVTLDFSQVEQPLLDQGTYLARVKSAKAATSKSGNPKITVVFSIESEEEEGYTIFHDITFTTKTIRTVQQNLKGLGFEFNSEVELDLDQLAADMKDVECYVLVDYSTASVNASTGENYPTRNIIKKITPA